MQEKPFVFRTSKTLTTVSGVAFGVTAAPLVAVAVFLLISLCALAVAIVVFLIGGFIGLFIWAAGEKGFLDGVVAVATWSFGIAKALLEFLGPFSLFCFSYITPIAGWIGIACGIGGAVIAFFARNWAKEADAEAQANAEASLDEQPVEETVPGKPIKIAQPLTTQNKAKPKRTLTRTATACLVLCIVFAALSALSMPVGKFVCEWLQSVS